MKLFPAVDFTLHCTVGGILVAYFRDQTWVLCRVLSTGPPGKSHQQLTLDKTRIVVKGGEESRTSTVLYSLTKRTY